MTILSNTKKQKTKKKPNLYSMPTITQYISNKGFETE